MRDNAENNEFCYLSAVSKDREKTFQVIHDSDVAVFSSPVYVDSIPSATLEFLYELSQEDFSVSRLKGILAVSNSGFYEAVHNENSLNIYKCFANKIEIKFIAGLGIGAGEMLESTKTMIPINSFFKRPVYKALSDIAQIIIENGKTNDFIFTTPRISKLLYKTISHKYWDKKGGKNGLTRKQLKKTLQG